MRDQYLKTDNLFSKKLDTVASAIESQHTAYLRYQLFVLAILGMFIAIFISCALFLGKEARAQEALDVSQPAPTLDAADGGDIGGGGGSMAQAPDQATPIGQQAAPIQDPTNAPVYEQTAPVQEEAPPVQQEPALLEQQTEPVYEQTTQDQVHAPVYEQAAALQEETSPVHRELTSLEQQVQPVYEQAAPGQEQATEPVGQPVDPVLDVTGQTAQPIQQTVAPVIQPVQNTIEQTVAPVQQNVEPVVEPVGQPVDPIVEPVQQSVELVIAPVTDTVNQTAKPIKQGVEPVVGIVNETTKPAKETVDPVVATTKPLLDPVKETVGPVLGPIKESTEPIVKPILDPVEETAEPVLKPVLETADPIMQPVKDSADPISVTTPVRQPETVMAAAKPVEEPLGQVVEPNTSRTTEPVFGSALDPVPYAVSSSPSVSPSSTLVAAQGISLGVSSDAAPASVPLSNLEDFSSSYRSVGTPQRVPVTTTASGRPAGSFFIEGHSSILHLATTTVQKASSQLPQSVPFSSALPPPVGSASGGSSLGSAGPDAGGVFTLLLITLLGGKFAWYARKLFRPNSVYGLIINQPG